MATTSIQQFVGGTASNRRKALLQAAGEHIPGLEYIRFEAGQPAYFVVRFKDQLYRLEKEQVEGFVAGVRLALTATVDDVAAAQIGQHRFS